MRFFKVPKNYIDFYIVKKYNLLDMKNEAVTYEYPFHQNVQAFTHLEDSRDTNLHKHNYYEIFYLVSGSSFHQCNDITEKITLGDMFLLRPSDKHRFIRPPNCTHRDIIMPLSFFEECCNNIDSDILSMINNSSKPLKSRITSNEIEFIENMIKPLTIGINFNTNHKFLLHISKITCTTLLSFFLKPMQENHQSEAPVWYTQLLEKLSDPKNFKYSLNELISDVPYNQIYLCRAFKKLSGTTMMDYFNKIKLNYAKLYLKTTNNSIETITTDLGFSSPSYFHKIFRSYMNCTPNEFRKMQSDDKSE